MPTAENNRRRVRNLLAKDPNHGKRSRADHAVAFYNRYFGEPRFTFEVAMKMAREGKNMTRHTLAACENPSWVTRYGDGFVMVDRDDNYVVFTAETYGDVFDPADEAADDWVEVRW